MGAPLSHLHGHVPPCAHHIHAHLHILTWMPPLPTHMDAFPLTLIASVPTCISPHRYVLSPHTDSHPFMIVTHSHLTRTDTWPLAQTHAHSHRHMPTRTDTCPLAQTHAHSHRHMDAHSYGHMDSHSYGHMDAHPLIITPSARTS